MSLCLISECDDACWGCTGPTTEDCKRCKKEYELVDNKCTGKDMNENAIGDILNMYLTSKLYHFLKLALILK